MIFRSGLIILGNISDNVVETFSIKSCRLWHNVEKYGATRQATDGDITRRVPIARRIAEATNTHSEYVTLNTFPQQKWLRERASMPRHTYIAYVTGGNNIGHCCRESSSSQWKHSSWSVCIPTLHCQYKGSARFAQEMCLSEWDIICMRLWLIPRRRWWFSTTSCIASHQISLCTGLSPYHTNPFNFNSPTPASYLQCQ